MKRKKFNLDSYNKGYREAMTLKDLHEKKALKEAFLWVVAFLIFLFIFGFNMDGIILSVFVVVLGLLFNR